MTAITDAVWDLFSLIPWPAADNQVAVTTATSNLTGATPRVLSQLNRFITVPATATVVLPSILTGEANVPVWVVNGAPTNALTVYAYADVGGHAEKINGTASTFGGATGGISIAAGAAALFIPEDVSRGRGGGSTASPLNWSCAGSNT